MIDTRIPTQISRLDSELIPSFTNELTGLVRLSNLEKGILTKPEIDQYFAEYQEAERRGKASIFIAMVAHNLFDDPEMGGLLHTSCNETERGVHIERLYVAGTARRANIGRLLLETAIEEAQEREAHYVQYDGSPETTVGRDLLDSYNFDEASGNMLWLAQVRG